MDFSVALDCGDFAFVRCHSCSLVQRNPQALDAEVESRYRDRHGKDYIAYELANEASFLRLQELALRDSGFFDLERDLLKEGAEKDSPPQILDIGCATGALLASLRERGWACTGAELCDPSAEYAREVRGLDVRSNPIERADLTEGSFDVVHASHLIEHLNDPRSFVRTVRRLLKPAGTLLVSTPNIDGFQARLFGSAWRSAIFDHQYLFSRRTLEALLISEGFKVLHVATWGGLAAGSAPKAIKQIADRIVKLTGSGDVMMLRAVPPSP